MSDIADIVKSIEIVSESFKQQIETINKTMEPIREGIRKMLEVTSGIVKFFEKTIYLDRYFYDVVLSMNVAISPKELEEGLESGKYKQDQLYIVYTIIMKRSKVSTLEINVTKEVADAIKTLIKNNPQYMMVQTNKVVFDEYKSELVIGGVHIPIIQYSDRYVLCQFMFGGNGMEGMPWELEDLAEVLLDRNEDQKHLPKYVYWKIRALNVEIKNYTGYKNFLIAQNKCYTINPPYLLLFEK